MPHSESLKSLLQSLSQASAVKVKASKEDQWNDTGTEHVLDEATVGQIDLDVARSFPPSLLPAQTPIERYRVLLRELLHTLLRRHPEWSYYQGLHSLLAIIILTFHPPSPINTSDTSDALVLTDELCAAAQYVLIHHVRDHLGQTLDPAFVQLRITHELLEQSGIRIPFDALLALCLPWLLSLFAHSVTDLQVAQRMLQIILRDGPTSPLFLSAAIVRFVMQPERADSETIAPSSMSLHTKGKAYIEGLALSDMSAIYSGMTEMKERPAFTRCPSANMLGSGSCLTSNAYVASDMQRLLDVPADINLLSTEYQAPSPHSQRRSAKYSDKRRKNTRFVLASLTLTITALAIAHQLQPLLIEQTHSFLSQILSS